MKCLNLICCFYLLGIFLSCEGANAANANDLSKIPAFDEPSIDSFTAKAAENLFLSDPWLVRITEGYSFGKFMGFKKNYGEIGLFFAPAALGDWQSFAEIRGYQIASHRRAVSVGVGMRLWDVNTSRVLGGNLYYDYQQASFDAFQRIGIGLESLGDRWDFRLNGYVLVNGSVKKGDLHVYHYLGGFMETCQQKQRAFRGLDAEIGYRLFDRGNFSIYSALGPYYYSFKHHEFFGGYIRLQMNWLDNFIVEARVSQDKEFHTQYQGRILIQIPFDALFTYTFDHPATERQQLLKQPVQRNPQIPTKKSSYYKQNW